jgi:hypothetical protein
MEARVEQELIQHAMVIMAGELWQELYNPDKDMGTYALCNTIMYQARLFVDEYKEKVGDADEDSNSEDFLVALSKYEMKVLKMYARESDRLSTSNGDFVIVKAFGKTYAIDDKDNSFYTFEKDCDIECIISAILSSEEGG